MATIPLIEVAKATAGPAPSRMPSQGFTVSLQDVARDVAEPMAPASIADASMGLAKMGQGISSFGEALAKASYAQQQDIAISQEFDAKMQMRAAGLQLEEYMAKNPTGEGYEVEAQKIAERTTAQIFKGKINGIAKRKLEQQIPAWQDEFVTRARIAGIGESRKWARSSIIADATTDFDDGHYDRASTTVDNGVASRHLMPEEGVRLKMAGRRQYDELQQKAQFETIGGIIQSGAQGAEDAVTILDAKDEKGDWKNLKALTYSQRMAARNSALTVQGQAREAEYGSAMLYVVTEPNPDPQEIQKRIDARKITPMQGAHLIRAIGDPDMKAPDDVANAIYTKVGQYDPDADPLLAKAYDLREEARKAGFGKMQMKRFDELLSDQKTLAGKEDDKGRRETLTLGRKLIDMAHEEGQLTEKPWQHPRTLVDDATAAGALTDVQWLEPAGIKPEAKKEIEKTSIPTEKVRLFQKAWEDRARTDASQKWYDSQDQSMKDKIDALLALKETGVREDTKIRTESMMKQSALRRNFESWWRAEDKKGVVQEKDVKEWIGNATRTSRTTSSVTDLRATVAPARPAEAVTPVTAPAELPKATPDMSPPEVSTKGMRIQVAPQRIPEGELPFKPDDEEEETPRTIGVLPELGSLPEVKY